MQRPARRSGGLGPAQAPLVSPDTLGSAVPCRVHCPLVQARLEVSDSFQPPPVCRKRHRAQRSRRKLCIRWQNAIPPEPGKDDCGCPCRPPSAGRCQNGLSESGRSLTVSPENELEEILWLRGGGPCLGSFGFEVTYLRHMDRNKNSCARHTQGDVHVTPARITLSHRVCGAREGPGRPVCLPPPTGGPRPVLQRDIGLCFQPVVGTGDAASLRRPTGTRGRPGAVRGSVYGSVYFLEQLQVHGNTGQEVQSSQRLAPPAPPTAPRPPAAP